uniref:Amidohydrolase-related domain-containing protein n=1 Tax=Anguilla anguilla TaxID=7936 RepID=A0A0E9PFD0_ANGAN
MPGLDVGDRLVMPGVVDCHVHVNEPGRITWEGYWTATRAAAAGGVTTIVDMPLNSIPPTTTLSNFQEKMKAATGQCFVDTAFWGGVIPDNQLELRPMIQAGVAGFKCFLIQQVGWMSSHT